MQAWVEQELKSADFGDQRLNARYRLLMDRLSAKPSLSIPAACEGWGETMAAYRFFDNDRVDADGILAPHQEATLERIREQNVVLLVQDTTELELTRAQEKMPGAGPLNEESRLGFFNHTMLAVTPERVPLGVVDAHVWARDLEEFLENQRDKQAKVRKKKQTPIEDKESFRWLEGLRRGDEIAAQAPDTTVVVVSDSEADIFECLAHDRGEEDQPQAEWIVRACQNRSLCSHDEQGAWKKLWDEAGSSPVLGTVEVEVSRNEPKSKSDRKRRQPRSPRTTTCTVQAAEVTLKGPSRPGGKLEDVTVNAVLVREQQPPADEEPIEWLLLTSLPVGTLELVCLVILDYCCRWQIEIYFRVLKSGCRVEELQLETADRFQPCLALYMIVAWRVMYALMLGRECPELPCDFVFSEEEWKAVYTVTQQQPPPSEPPPLGEMVEMIATMGGYLGRKHDGPPGPKTMWVGMQRMRDLAIAWQTFGRPRKQAENCV